MSNNPNPRDEVEQAVIEAAIGWRWRNLQSLESECVRTVDELELAIDALLKARATPPTPVSTEKPCVVTSDGKHRYSEASNGTFCDFCGDPAPASPLIVPACVKCGHNAITMGGTCLVEVPISSDGFHGVWHSDTRLCACKCEFPTAEVEAEREIIGKTGSRVTYVEQRKAEVPAEPSLAESELASIKVIFDWFIKKLDAISLNGDKPEDVMAAFREIISTCKRAAGMARLAAPARDLSTTTAHQSDTNQEGKYRLAITALEEIANSKMRLNADPWQDAKGLRLMAARAVLEIAQGNVPSPSVREQAQQIAHRLWRDGYMKTFSDKQRVAAIIESEFAPHRCPNCWAEKNSGKDA